MSDNYIGEIRTVGFNYAPVGWATCNGQLLSINENDALFALIGTTYGGDGVNTFGVPDLRGRVAVNTGNGPGLANYTLGQMGGAENVTLTANQLPPHGHPFILPLAASTTGTLSDDPAGKLPGLAANTYLSAAQSGKTLAPTAATGTTLPTGGNQSHPNVQPVQALNYIIATQGIYPPQS